MRIPGRWNTSIHPMLFVDGLRVAPNTTIFATGIVFFAIGSIKSRWSTSSWWNSGIATLAVGAIAASLAYFTGVVLKQLLA